MTNLGNMQEAMGYPEDARSWYRYDRRRVFLTRVSKDCPQIAFGNTALRRKLRTHTFSGQK